MPPVKQIGYSEESKLLSYISGQLNRLGGVISATANKAYANSNTLNTFLGISSTGEVKYGILPVVLDTEANTQVFSYKTNVDVKGQGQITLTNGSASITGVGTNFTDATTGIGPSYWFNFWVKDSANNWYRLTISAITNATTATLSNSYARSDIRGGYASFSSTFQGVSGTYDFYTVKNWSDGLFSSAFGNNTYADNFGFSFGGSSVATGSGAVALGFSAISTALQSFAIGRLTRATGNYSFAGGKGLDQTTATQKVPLASGQAAFAFYEATSAQTAGHGAQGANSVILGGINGNVPSDSPRSAIIGGNAIKADATLPDMVYVPNLRIVSGKLRIIGIPTSSSGLPSGSVWSNANVLTIVP